MLRKAVSAVVVVCAAVGMSATSVAAQDDAFTPNTMYIGPVLGLGGLGSANMSFGGRFEKGLRPLPDLGNGILGILVGINYYSWSSSGAYLGGAWEYSVKYIPIGVTANYHFVLENKKLDPWVGAGLGYQIVSASCSYPGQTFDCGYSNASALYFIARAGGQYRFNEKLGVYADAGAGDAAINFGIMARVGN